MGFMISLSGLISLGASYIVRIFISNTGGVEQVGLYTAGFAIINTYVGMIFTAMSTDYYPRLSAVSHNNIQSKQVINQQAEIALLILAPILMIFLVFINWVVLVLYSSKFIPVNEMISWAALGIFFKAASWPVGFIFLAKGATKVFFLSELVANMYLLLFNIIGYKYLGLTGLGLSFLVSYILVLIQVFLIAKYKFEFNFNTSFYQIFLLQLLLVISCFILVRIVESPFSYFVGIILIVISAFFAFKELDKRLDIKSIIISLKTRF
jgi:O-antigen/teichoic acid export membrane protein